MKVCDNFKDCRSTSQDLYEIHTAIYVNVNPYEEELGSNYPTQLSPITAEICKKCLDNMEYTFKSLSTLTSLKDINRQYSNLLWER